MAKSKTKLRDFMCLNTCVMCNGAGVIHSVDQVLVGSYVYNTRRQAGVKQGELANALGISQTYLCDLEKGNRNWSNYLFTKTMNILEGE